MKQYVGVLSPLCNGSHMAYFKQYLYDNVQFYESYEQFIMLYDAYCLAILIPCDLQEMAKMLNFADENKLTVLLYRFHENQCKLYQIKELDQADVMPYREDSTLTLQKRSEQIRIYMHDILYIESDKFHIYIHLQNDTLCFRMRLIELYQLLDHEHFQRCHQSFIVNMHYIYKLKRYEILLQNGAKIPISKTYTKTIRTVYTKQFVIG